MACASNPGFDDILPMFPSAADLAAHRARAAAAVPPAAAVFQPAVSGPVMAPNFLYPCAALGGHGVCFTPVLTPAVAAGVDSRPGLYVAPALDAVTRGLLGELTPIVGGGGPALETVLPAGTL